MSYLPTIDDRACSALGDCAAIAPSVFAVDETAVVIGTGTAADILAAAEACPALAITVTDAATGEIIFP